MKRLAAGCIIVRDNSILLLHRIDKDWWEVPGGKAELGETGEQTAKREAKEELGCRVEIIRELGKTNFLSPKGELDYTWFLAEIRKGQSPKIGVPREYDRFEYLPLNKLKTYKLSSSAKNLTIEIEKGRVSLL